MVLFDKESFSTTPQLYIIPLLLLLIGPTIKSLCKYWRLPILHINSQYSSSISNQKHKQNKFESDKKWFKTFTHFISSSSKNSLLLEDFLAFPFLLLSASPKKVKWLIANRLFSYDRTFTIIYLDGIFPRPLIQNNFK